MLVTRRDEKNVAAIEKLIGQPIARRSIEIPAGEQRSPDRPKRERRSPGRERRPTGARAQSQAPRGRAIGGSASLGPAATGSVRTKAGEPKVTAPSEPETGQSRDASELPAFLLRPVKLPALKPARKATARQPESTVSDT
jgi:hypothetical protein